MKQIRLNVTGTLRVLQEEEPSYIGVSTLHLRTHWLRLAGIEKGDTLKIEVDGDKLIISKKEVASKKEAQ